MLIHVVMMNLRDPEADADRLAGLLNDLNGQIPELQSMAAGRNVVASDRAWDLALVSRFDDLAAMQAYQTHPAHVAVGAQIRAAATELAAVDFDAA